LGAIVKVNDALTLRASFGLGFRAPDLGQLYYRFLNPTNFYQVMGNPNLNPEHSQSIQAGAVYTQRRYRFGATLFRNNIRDLIDSQLAGTPTTTAQLNAIVASYGLPPGFDPFLNRQLFIYVNLAKVRTQGVELDGAISLTRNLRASAAYTFLQALNGVTNAPLTQRHRHNGQMRLEYSLRRLGVSANIRGSFYSHWILNAATGTRGLPFKIFDAYVAKDWQRGLQTFVAIDNFNNSRDGKLQLATPTFDRPDYGRTVRIGLRYRFGGAE
jgi:outer membrane receptor for ferrienterochelin and colicins